MSSKGPPRNDNEQKITDTLYARPNHILIVEDDEMIRAFLTLQLENSGFTTSGVECGVDMFETLE